MLAVLFWLTLISINILNTSPVPKTKWTFNTKGSKALGGPAIDSNGDIYLPVDGGYVHKISSKGKSVWMKQFMCTLPDEEILPNGIPVSCKNAVPSNFNMSLMPDSIWYQIGGTYPTSFGGTSPILLNNDKYLLIVDLNCAHIRILNTNDGSTKYDFNIYSIHNVSDDHWDYGGGLYTSPALSTDGKTIYIPSGNWWGDQWYEASQVGVNFRAVTKRKILDRRLYAFTFDDETENGLTLKWMFEAEYTDTNRTAFFSSPAIGPDGTIYVGNFNGFMYALKDNTDSATILWKYAARNNTNPNNLPVYNNVSWPTYSEWWSSPAISTDGSTVYIGNNDYKLYAFDALSGDIKWTYFMSGQVYQSPVIGGNGTIYISCENDGAGNDGADGNIYALNPDGTLKWKTATTPQDEGVPGTCAMVLDDETVIFGSNYPYFWAYDGNNGNLKWKAQIGSWGNDMSPAVAPDGTIIVHTTEMLYALEGDIPLNTKSAWPKFRATQRNTGQFVKK